MLSDEVKNKIEVINKYVGDNKEGLDKIIPNERITLINMDIEGAEAETLRASAKVIEENHPVLAICVYHKPEDLLEIPNIIREIYPGYKFFLRKYPSCVGNFYHAKCKVNELVLYAIPPEYMESW
ncbi:MAG: FkbM family methyltransferase [Lachnospiraceae bacterium]|nr:FkbM family methyltransferase [Lachnospiraceae bacterium]